MAWDIDSICWFSIRDKILKDRYAGVQYSMMDSFSPIIVRHREVLSLKDRRRIQKLFPKWIRIEFQEVKYEGEITSLYGEGRLLSAQDISEFKSILSRLSYGIDFEGKNEYVKRGEKWEPKDFSVTT